MKSHPHDIWIDRTKFIATLIDPDSSVIDFGCGSMAIKEIAKIKNYLGIDLQDADINIDLNAEFPKVEHYNLGLVIGVLEYLDKPEDFLKKVKEVTDKMIICCLITSKPKKSWKTHLKKEQITSILDNMFDEVIEKRYGPKYYIYICK